MQIATRLTRKFNLSTPIIGAPMAFAAGGKLAGAITRAGGLGMIGGAYGDPDWLREELRAADGARVGVGFITWKLAKNPEVLGQALDAKPAAIFLSFGDVAPFAQEIHAAKVPLIAQVQTLKDANAAADAGADVIVAQGAEAGGHGESRATMTLVPEVADWLAKKSPDTLLVAAGGVADGRGLAAVLMLGAEGAVMGSRLWASDEALVHPNMHRAALAATGDDTIRSSVMDIARKLDWPARYTASVLKNAFTERWHDDIAGLLTQAEEQSQKWREAWAAGDTRVANTFVGQATGILNDIRPAAEIIATISQEAETLLAQAPNLLEA
ncbi:NAD(P)H-dependent flavin oxidoreductase [Falsihalocynthiibacter sp. SS001]|uniref:NAD(P)H-dependent flavin oxidoreductase n=1 Tax=Falsihalocynthiibacter sp. SS001 TaxID=3349698 RepID=UPI0036D2E5EB